MRLTRTKVAILKKKRQEKRLQKARTIKTLLNSNLPPEIKKREIQKLSGVASQTRGKSIFFKLHRTPREVKQASEANF